MIILNLLSFQNPHPYTELNTEDAISDKNKNFPVFKAPTSNDLTPIESLESKKIEVIKDDSSFLSQIAMKVVNLILNYPVSLMLATGFTVTGIAFLATLNFPVAFAFLTCGLVTAGSIYFQSSNSSDFDKAVNDLQENIQDIRDVNENISDHADKIKNDVTIALSAVENITKENEEVKDLAEKVHSELEFLAEKTTDKEAIKSIKSKIETILKHTKNEKEQLKDLNILLQEIAHLTEEVKKGTEEIKVITLKADANIEKIKKAARADKIKTTVLATGGAVIGSYVGGSIGGVIGGVSAPIIYEIVKNLYQGADAEEVVKQPKKPINMMQQVLLLGLRNKIALETQNGTRPLSNEAILRYSEMFEAILDENYSKRKAKENEAFEIVSSVNFC